MSDDEIIKKRLLIDGDGTGDDRRLNVVLKHFLKWTNAKTDSPENNQMSYDRLLAQVAQSQFAAAKTDYISKMIDEELQTYGKISDQIEKSIEMAKQQIEESKQELVVAKQIRKNKIEYDLLAKLIKEQPDRKETMKEIETLKKELNDLLEQKIKLERKFQKRRNDFTLLMYCIRELESQLEDDDDNDADEDSSDSGKSANGGVLEDDDDVVVIGGAAGRVHGGGSLGGNSSQDTTGGDGLNGVVSGAMDLSDDDQPMDSDKVNKRRKREKDYSKEPLTLEEDESKEPMSVDEDTVLELSIDKDEHDVVKLDESLGTT